MTTLHILHLYPKEMNLYGDHGNILTLKKRAEWRGFRVNVAEHHIGDQLPNHIDIIFGGGGQDSGQSKIEADLRAHATELKTLIEQAISSLANISKPVMAKKSLASTSSRSRPWPDQNALSAISSSTHQNSAKSSAMKTTPA